jgi:hypothetical protein
VTALLIALLLAATPEVPDAAQAQRLSDRALGDLALKERRFEAARDHYRRAAPGARGLLAEELRQKQALAEQGLRQTRWAWASMALVALALGWLGWRIARGRAAAARLPTELWFAVPVYALLVVGGLGRDPAVLRALTVGGGASLVLIALSGLASQRAPARPWLHALVLVAANLALFYVVLFEAGLLSKVSN